MSKSMMTMICPPAPRPRLAPYAALALGAASRLLDRLAARLMRAPAARPLLAEHAPSLEFYADASAPEGALYLDGELVGRLPGVTRL